MNKVRFNQHDVRSKWPEPAAAPSAAPTAAAARVAASATTRACAASAAATSAAAPAAAAVMSAATASLDSKGSTPLLCANIGIAQVSTIWIRITQYGRERGH